MLDFSVVHPLAEEYAASHTTAEGAALQAVSSETYLSHPHAHMLSGHVQGRLLSMISKMVQPRYILEIGTFTGYSALCLAEGLALDGHLHTIEIREEDAAVALANFKRAGKDNQITLHRTNALGIIPTLPYTWDLVFIDADKVSYIDYYEIIVPRLSNKGIILADNVLFHGQVLHQSVKGKNALAIDRFNQHVSNDSRVEQVMLTVRDGLLMIKKKTA